MNPFQQVGLYLLSRVLYLNITKPNYLAAKDVLGECNAEIEAIIPELTSPLSGFKLNKTGSSFTRIGDVQNDDSIRLDLNVHRMDEDDRLSFAQRLCDLTGLKMTSQYDYSITLESPTEISLYTEGQTASQDLDGVKRNKSAPAEYKAIVKNFRTNKAAIEGIFEEMKNYRSKSEITKEEAATLDENQKDAALSWLQNMRGGLKGEGQSRA